MRFSPSPRNGLSALDGIAGVSLALYLLVGRWTFSRLESSDDGLGQVRFPVMAMLVMTTLLYGAVRPSMWDRKAKTRDCVTLLLVVFFLYLIGSSSWASPGEFRGLRVLDISVLLVGTLCLYQILGCARPDVVVEWFWRTLAVCGSLFVMLSLTSALRAGERLAVLGGGPNVFGRNMGLMSIGALYLLSLNSKSWYWAFAVAIAPVMVVLSGSRGSSLSMLAGLAVCLVLGRLSLRRAVCLICCGAVTLFLLRDTVVWSVAADMYNTRVNGLAAAMPTRDGRAGLHAVAMALGLAHIIGGAGLSSFSAAMGEYDYPHNIGLEVFAEGGLIGLLLLGTALLLGVWRGYAYRDRRTGLALTFTSSQFSGDLYDSRGVFAFLLLSLASQKTMSARPAPDQPGGASWAMRSGLRNRGPSPLQPGRVLIPRRTER